MATQALDLGTPARAVDVASGDSPPDLLSSERQRQLLWGFLLLGLVARLVRYLLRFPLWEDEAFLCVNFMDRGYAEILQPLEYHQVAPPLFLWAEVTAVKLFGFNEWSLRLFPLLCGVASLLLFRRFAGRLVRGTALVVAVAFFAAAYPCVRHAAEAKQYASDLCVALVLLTLAVEWWRHPERVRWLWALAASAPVAVWLSYPAAFVGGGVSLAVFYVLLAGRRRDGWLAWVAYNVALCGSFGALALTVIRAQSSAEMDFMTGCWVGAFPPLSSPWEFAKWFVVTHASETLAYPFGGARGMSTATFLACVTGVLLLVRRRRWPVLLLALAPAALHLTASALGRYPYGVHFKLTQHLAPAICVLAGLGVAAWAGRFAGRRLAPRLVLGGALVCAGLAALGCMARDIITPYKSPGDYQCRAFAQWYWFSTGFKGESVCALTDLGLHFAPNLSDNLNASAIYLCNQRIYSPRHAAKEPPRLQLVSAEHPLRCAVYRVPRLPFDQAALDRWLAGMQQTYRLVYRESHPLVRLSQRGDRVIEHDSLDVYTFVPREGTRETAER